MERIEGLKQCVSRWLAEHELARDTRFCTREEWKARGEGFLADSSLVLVFEGALYSVVNGDHEDSIKLYGNLERLVHELGSFFELGHAWSMGFYPLSARRLTM